MHSFSWHPSDTVNIYISQVSRQVSQKDNTFYLFRVADVIKTEDWLQVT